MSVSMTVTCNHCGHTKRVMVQEQFFVPYAAASRGRKRNTTGKMHRPTKKGKKRT